MRAITQYLLRQIASPLLFASLTLAGVIWLTQSLRFIDRIVNNNLNFGAFLYLTLLVLPSVTSIILPIAGFCAAIYAYNRLALDSELVVLAGSGFNRFSLARPAIMIAAGMMVALYVIGLYLGPLSARTLRSTQFEFRANYAGMVILEGVFNTPSPTLTVYVRERDASGEMRGILVHDNRDTKMQVTMMAERAAMVMTPQGPRMVMMNGNRQQIEAGKRSLSILYFDSYSLDLSVYSKPEAEGWREPHERYLHELFSPNMQDADDRNNYNKLIAEGHRRIVTPFYAMALMLIAVCGVVCGEFNRRGHTKRLILAALAAIILQLVSLGVTQIAAKSPLLIPVMYLAPLTAIAGALLMLRERDRAPGRALRMAEAA